jgi:predicted nucleic acid-binding protein
VDTSCLVAIAFGEPGADELAARLGTVERLVASNLLEAELRAALRREEVSANPADLLTRMSWLLPDRPLTLEFGMVLDAGYLRGADLWHVACALFLDPGRRSLAFFTLDTRQAGIAGVLGFAGL